MSEPVVREEVCEHCEGKKRVLCPARPGCPEVVCPDCGGTGKQVKER